MHVGGGVCCTYLGAALPRFKWCRLAWGQGWEVKGVLCASSYRVVPGVWCVHAPAPSASVWPYSLPHARALRLRPRTTRHAVPPPNQGRLRPSAHGWVSTQSRVVVWVCLPSLAGLIGALSFRQFACLSFSLTLSVGVGGSRPLLSAYNG